MKIIYINKILKIPYLTVFWNSSHAFLSVKTSMDSGTTDNLDLVDEQIPWIKLTIERESMFFPEFKNCLFFFG